MAIEPPLAFCVREHHEPSLEVRVNFGVFAGRHVTPAEIQELARELAPAVSKFSVISEQRHEFEAAVEASLHQVRIEVARDVLAGDAAELCDRLVATAERWAEACIADRRAEISEL